VKIHRLSIAPVIDGKLEDTVWQEGNLLDGFTQFEPEMGKPASEKTEVRVGYDAVNLYFGIRCFDSEPKKIFGGAMRADADLSQDDSVTIILDTFLDRRNGFLLTVNPIGARTDALLRNEGEEVNVDWDGLWDAATTRDSLGWTAEIAVPFKTLRFGRAIDWTYRPGSDLFLVYNDVDDLDPVRRESGFSPLQPGRTITIKATRRFDF
jgi:hypothetical protein